MQSPNQIEIPSNRKFGFFVTFVLFVASAYLFYNGFMSFSYGFGVTAIVFLLATLINAEILNPLNRLWMSFGLLLGKIMNPVVIGFIFFGLFAPISLFTRVFGRDELRLRVRKSESYWRHRKKTDNKNCHFKNQF
jgi:hypothetical protein